MTRAPAAGSPAWLLAICASRVGAYMVCWAFVSLGIAGAGAVASAVVLHAASGAAMLRGGGARAGSASVSAR
jgi:hypothetical protein